MKNIANANGMYRRALLRGLYASCATLSVLWITCDHFDTEPVAALTVGVLVSMFDWIDIGMEERRRGRVESGEDQKDTGESGSLHVPAFMVSIASLCAVMICAGSIASAFYRVDYIETVTTPAGADGAEQTHTIKTHRPPWATGIEFEAEHARRAIKAAEAAEETQR